MHENDFHVGLRLSLAVNDSDDRFDMSVVGWIRRAYLIATGPELGEADISSRDDCIVRFINEGSAFGFQTSMLRKQRYPIPLLFFKYPAEIKSMPFRKARRLSTNIASKIMKQTQDSGFITAETRILDLNETGCLLEVPCSVPMSFAADTEYFLSFPIMDKNIEVDCVIRNVRKYEDNYHLGSQFIRQSQTAAELLKNFVSIVAE